MTSPHYFPLSKTAPQQIRPGGNRIDVTAETFPILSGLSLSLLTLNSQACREPHWHPNANELSYCLEGRALMTIFSPKAGHDTFTIEKGDIVFVPKGALHHIANIGESQARFLISFDHERPEDIEFSSSLCCMPNHVLQAAVNLTPNVLDACKAAGMSVFISTHHENVHVPISPIANQHKLNLETMQPQIRTPGGTVALSNGFLIPPLSGLACYSLHLYKGGIREPHWHPNAAELNYLICGSARITVLSPGDKIDTFDLKAGDVSFIPRGYFHHIENTGKEEARFAVFFNNEYPSDIGITGSFGAFPNSLFSSVFHVPTSYFHDMKKYQEDKFVIAGGG